LNILKIFCYKFVIYDDNFVIVYKILLLMKVYFDETIIGKEWWIPFLNPILWICKWWNPDSTWFYSEEQILDWTTKWKKLLSYSNVELCDYIVFPINFKIDYISLLEEQTKLWKEYGKKVIVFYYNDCEYSIPNLYNNLIVFRTSMNDLNPDNEFFMPWFPNDLWKEYWIDYKSDLDDVSIWYVGYRWYYSVWSYLMYILAVIKFFFIEKTFIWDLIYKVLINRSRKWWFLKKKIWEFLWKKWIIKDPEIVGNSFLYLFYCFNKWKICREKTIESINKSWIKFKFIEKNKLLKPRNKDKRDYVSIIKNCTFPLATRWDGNYSYRLYEIMSLWKIPLFIDTKCRLPFDNEIDYKNIFVWVPFDDIKNIKKYVDGYLSKNKNKLEEIQKNIRFIYENYLTMNSYYIKIIHQLAESLK